MIAEWALVAVSILVPMVTAAAAFGAVRAGFRSEVTRLDEKAEHAKKKADEAQQAAVRAHDRIDNLQQARG
jgi:hypothetical protein